MEDSGGSFPVPTTLRMRMLGFHRAVIGFPPVLTIARTSAEIGKP